MEIVGDWLQELVEAVGDWLQELVEGVGELLGRQMLQQTDVE